MPDIRTPEEVRSYINSHAFITRHHAYCIRAYVLSKYEEKADKLADLNYKYPFKKGEDMDLPTISANDAIKFLTEK